MKIETKPIISMEVTITLNHSEVAMLNRLCSYGVAVVEPIIGKNALPDKIAPWQEFITQMRSLTDGVGSLFADTNDVFSGRKVASERKRTAPIQDSL